MIFEEQSAVHDVFILTDGMVKLYRLLEDGRRQITGFLVTGDILGSPKREASAHCTAQAVTDLQACAFERSAFFGLLLRYRDLALRLLIMATDEIETQHEHTVIIGRKRTDERLAAFLVTLHARWTEAGETEEVVHLPMSRADIGDYLGLTIESVSRAFSRLKGAGVIDIPSPHRIVLRNLPALHDLAGLEHLPARTVTLGL